MKNIIPTTGNSSLTSVSSALRWAELNILIKPQKGNNFNTAFFSWTIKYKVTSQSDNLSNMSKLHSKSWLWL